MFNSMAPILRRRFKKRQAENSQVFLTHERYPAGSKLQIAEALSNRNRQVSWLVTVFIAFPL